MPIKIVHFAVSPLAGAPVRLAAALRRHGGLDARLVDLHRWGRFEHDLVADEDPQRVADLAAEADILHLHNTVSLDETGFTGVDFHALRESGKAILRHYHSPRELVARHLGCDERDLAEARDGVPALVVAQYHERQYPLARVVPNLLEAPADEPGDPTCDICFGYASSYAGVHASASRWNTKGVPETLAMLKRLARRRPRLDLRVLSDSPHGEMLAARVAARINLDEMVTGSYHLSALEALAAGRATLGLLDQRCREVLAFVTGAASCPILNTPLERAEAVLEALLDDPTAADALGRESRRWMLEHYAPARLVQHYVEAYGQLLARGRLERQAELSLDGPGRRFVALALADAQRDARLRGGLRRPLFSRSTKSLQKSLVKKLGGRVVL